MCCSIQIGRSRSKSQEDSARIEMGFASRLQYQRQLSNLKSLRKDGLPLTRRSFRESGAEVAKIRTRVLLAGNGAA